jgi:hypothetical protein
MSHLKIERSEKAASLRKHNQISILLYQHKASAGNPYLMEMNNIIHSLGMETTIASEPFWEKNDNFDVIHLQWPEELVDWRIPTDEMLDRLEETLGYWKKRSKIIVTRHNILPHQNINKQYYKLYDLVLGFADGIMHLGEFSRKDYLTRYQNTPFASKQVHGIVPHPIYTSYKNEVTQQEARKILGIPMNKKVFLIFGSIRSSDEKKFIRQVFNGLKIRNKYLLFSYYPIKRFTGSKYLKPIYKIWLNRSKSSKFFFEKVDAEQVQYFLNASDILFIQRKENLNSGLVFLGFQFSKLIVGPAVNNIRSVLERTNQFTFDPKKPETASRALEEASLSQFTPEEIRESINRNYPSEDEIGKNYLQFINEVMLSDFISPTKQVSNYSGK